MRAIVVNYSCDLGINEMTFVEYLPSWKLVDEQATTTLVHFSYRIIFFISRPYTILLPSPTLATTLSMAQPDLGRLAQNIRNAGDGLQTASTELTLLENLPSIHDRQAAHNNHQELVGLIQHLTTRVDTVERGLNMRLDNVNTRLDHVIRVSIT